MISPFEAKVLIRKHTVRLTAQKVPLSECFGSVLAADVTAPFAMPIADNSAMDGYAIRSSDTAKANRKSPVFLKISGTLKAGDSKQFYVAAKTACRIMTGAFIPQGADAVIPKEDVVIANGGISINSPALPGRHIRWQGEEVKKKQLLLRKGTVLDPAAIGILANFGRATVLVYPKPKIAVLATGNELIPPGRKLSRGKIYDSNSWMVCAALYQMGIRPFRVFMLRDEAKSVRDAVRKSLRICDCLILLGGVSAGDYDVVKEALASEGAKTIFSKVSQKPGKPLYFGRKGRKIIFGLPGNPAAVFTCFYGYAYPALLRMAGYPRPELVKKNVRVEGVVSCDPKRHLFLKARVLNGKRPEPLAAQILSRQASHMLSSLADTDGFLRVPAGRNRVRAGRQFQMDFLPYKIHK